MQATPYPEIPDHTRFHRDELYQLPLAWCMAERQQSYDHIITVLDAYMLSAGMDHQWRRRTYMERLGHRVHISTHLYAIDSGSQRYLPFFLSHLVPHSEPRPTLVIPSPQWFCFGSKDLLTIKNREFRMHFQDKDVSPISAKTWKEFWKVKMPHRSRTIWWRTIQRKLPAKATLHHRMPTKHPSPACSICGEKEDNEHLLITCPPKYVVWHKLFMPIVQDERPLKELLCDSVFRLTRSVRPTTLRYSDTHQAIASTLHVIWSQHWMMTFDKVVFSPDNCLQLLDREFTKVY